MNTQVYQLKSSFKKFAIYWGVILLITFFSSFSLTINPIQAIQVSGIATLAIFIWHYLYFHQWQCFSPCQKETNTPSPPKNESFTQPQPQSQSQPKEEHPSPQIDNITDNPFDYP